tara:strand:- start:191 stop:643 length:453 start_codon:yes stop_codon:yes gene_type:complete
LFKRLIINSDLQKLQFLANKIAKIAKVGDVILLYGELGVGKTTFARFFINSIFKKYSLKQPNNIRSPSFPIMINYPLIDFEIFHYDLYRLKNNNDLIELNIEENLRKNITLIEWPEIFFETIKFQKYYSVNLKVINSKQRHVDIFYKKIK